MTEVMTERVIFLDVDGPLIPAGMYLIDRKCSFDRRASPICIAVVNRICEDSGAKIVMNTTHNINGATMLSDMVREGIKEPYLHEFPMTRYPQKGRWWAIKLWQKEHGNVDWVALDDAPFTEDRRLVLIDFEVGVNPKHYNEIADLKPHWGMKKIFIF